MTVLMKHSSPPPSEDGGIRRGNLNDEIRNIFVRNGFKTKVQDGGETDLNPYVYDAVYALIEELHRTGRIKFINKGKKTIVGCFSPNDDIKEIEY